MTTPVDRVLDDFMRGKYAVPAYAASAALNFWVGFVLDSTFNLVLGLVSMALTYTNHRKEIAK